jgi:hypothetical protein
MRRLLDNAMSCAAHYANPRIGVMLSGGVDSAILYYLIMLENFMRGGRHAMGEDIDLYEIVPMCAPKKDGANFYAEKVNAEVCRLLGIPAPKILYIGNPWELHNEIVTNAIVTALHYNVVTKIFVADNITPKVKFPGLEPQRVKSEHDAVQQPFFKMTKDKIIDLYYTNGVSNLLKVTHSCTEQKQGRCNQCWQCHERAWAFQQLGLSDPGTE